jgi:hypothetical protein
MTQPSSEAAPHTNPHRQFIRHTIDVPLEISAADAGTVVDQGVNVSHGGLAFLSAECIDLGKVVQVRIPSVEPPFEAHARVVWCRPEADQFLVGVEFLDAGDAFGARMVQQVCSIENYRKQVLVETGRELTSQEAAEEWIQLYAGRFPDSETA